MTEKERKIFCLKFEQIKKLFLDYETYIFKNRIKIKKEKIKEKSFYFSGILVACGTFIFGVYNLLFGRNTLEFNYFIFIIMFIAAIGIFIIAILFSAFFTQRKEKYFSKEEFDIYRKNKCIYSVLEELRFPQDYMCSEFAQAVIDELKRKNVSELNEVYLKCKCVDFDLDSKKSQLIIKNRFYINKAKNFIGIK